MHQFAYRYNEYIADMRRGKYQKYWGGYCSCDAIKFNMTTNKPNSEQYSTKIHMG